MPLSNEDSASKSSDTNVQAAEQLEKLVDLLVDVMVNQEDSSESESVQEAVIPEKIKELPPANDPKPQLLETEKSTVSGTSDQEDLVVDVIVNQEDLSDSESVQEAVIPEKIKELPPANDPKPQLLETGGESSDQEDLDHLRQLIGDLQQKLIELENQVYEPTELVNPLLPLIAELLRLKVSDSRESLLDAIVPIIDQAIEKRAQQDSRAMSNALAMVIPAAISQQMKEHPEEVARAIAPEIALAIREQIKLERDSIARTLGPEMGKAIKAQIEHERDAMVDALYPVIGGTISKYMAEVVRSINQQVETALSPEGIKRKIRAKLKGVSEAELILNEAMPFTVEAIFLIHKATGLLIQEVQLSQSQRLDSEMLAGMLTAIRSFVNDWIARSGDVSELDKIEYGNSRIILEVAGYCYLAVIVKGEPSKSFIERIRQTLSQIIQDYDQQIQEFDGDPALIPASLQPLIKGLIETETESVASQKKSPNTLLILVFIVLGAILIPWGIINYRSRIANQIEAKAATALDATPELSVYRITPEVERGTLTLTGRVPNQYLRSEAEQVAKQVAPDLELDNNIIAVDVPPDPVFAAAEVKRVTSVLNQNEGVMISAEYENRKVTVEGIIPEMAQAQKIGQAFEEIPGVYSVVNTVQSQPPSIPTKIGFDSGSVQLKSADISDKIAFLVEYLRQYPQVELKIIGSSDPTGTSEVNKKLALARARVVKQALEKQGIDSNRLQIDNTSQSGRVVRFEPVITLKKGK